MTKHFLKISTVVRALATGLTILLFLVFLLFRLSFLEVSPPGFFVDESSIGLNAYHVLTTGQDEYGISFPLYFRAFGDYKNPVYVYSVVPLLAIFGVSVHTVRLAAALWGVAALAVFFSLIRQRSPSLLVASVSLLLVATNPWLLMLARVAFEVAALPAFLFAAAACLHWLLEKKLASPRQALLLGTGVGLSLGIMFYTYTAARVTAPLLAALGVFLLWRQVGAKVALVAGGVFALCFVPLLLSDSFQNGALLARYNVVGLSHYTETSGEFVATAVHNYLGHFSPEFLRGGGDGNLRHVPVPYGVFLTSSLVFVGAGLVRAISTHRSAFGWWCLGGLLVSPLPSALTIQSPHVLRSVGMVVFLLIFAWYGVLSWSETKQVWWKVVGALTTGLVLIESLLLLRFFLTQFPATAEAWFDHSTVQAIETALQHPGPYFFSSQLYPGTEASVAFLAAKWHRTATPDSVYFFDPTLGLDIDHGVIVSDWEFCPIIQQEYPHFLVAYDGDGACVLWSQF